MLALVLPNGYNEIFTVGADPPIADEVNIESINIFLLSPPSNEI